MQFWSEIVGQESAVGLLEAASQHENELSHAWLVTGPAGSGRSRIATHFAAALIARSNDEREQVLAQVRAGTHPDFKALATQKVQISIDEVRELIGTAYFAPALGRHRVILIEDADRMTERTSNVLLKALEEPPERTIWILCAPSEADLLPTIRSRARSLRLVTPSTDEVSTLLQQRDHIAPDRATQAARLAQQHVGMARRLATDDAAFERRQRSLELVLGVDSVASAMAVAAQLHEIATEDAKALSAANDELEREQFRRNLGLNPGEPVPKNLNSQLKQLEDDQKRRATRNLRDGVDRVLTDVLSLYRDILMVQLDAGMALTNEELAAAITTRAERTTPEDTLRAIKRVEVARDRIASNVTPTLALEAMLV